jgi:FkbM family methyltransferase
MESELESVLCNYVNSKPIGSLIVKYVHYLKKFKDFNPKVIFDIGASYNKFTELCNYIYPDAKVHLFEASPPDETCNNWGNYNEVCLSNEDNKEITFYNNKNEPRLQSYFKTELSSDDNITKMNSRTLESYCKEKDIPSADLIKISCCGSERDIIDGGLNIIKKCKYLIVSLQNKEVFIGAPLANNTGPYIESLGFQGVDILDCYDSPFIDYVFINKNI